MANLAVHIYESPMVFDDPKYCRKPQSGSLANLLGSKERLEDLVEDFRRHACSCIMDGKKGIGPGPCLGMHAHILFIDTGVLDFDCQDRKSTRLNSSHGY